MIPANELMPWLDRISCRNRQMLICPDLSGIAGGTFTVVQRVKQTLRRWRGRVPQEIWVTAVNALGAIWMHKVFRGQDDLSALRTMFGRHLNSKGDWHQPLQAVDFAMKGYSLLYLVETTGEECYRRAAYFLADTLLHDYPRTSEATLLYNRRLEALLVDTLGMVCPFLARYSRLFECDETRDLCVHQVRCFIRQNLDTDTHLPYHGYYPGGPVRLGMQGWSRGTGWYMVGLADALLEIAPENPQRRELQDAFISVASSVRKFQRPDGHWGWAMLLRDAHLDSSATAYIAYSMLRCVEGGVLDETYMSSIDMAIRALMMVTRNDGLIDGSLSDCFGLSLYPQTFGPQPWLQGMATALGAVYAMRLKCR